MAVASRFLEVAAQMHPKSKVQARRKIDLNLTLVEVRQHAKRSFHDGVPPGASSL